MKPEICTKCGGKIGGGICITVICEDGDKYYFCTSLCAADWLTPFKDLKSGEIKHRRKRNKQ